MSVHEINTYTTIGDIFIWLYFLILATERIQSLVRAGKHKVLYTDSLHKYMAILCYMSFAGTILIMWERVARLRQFILDMNTYSMSMQEVMDYNTTQVILVCCAVGCLLLSGMVHTEYSIPGLQFGAYGALIIVMVTQVIIQVRSGDATAGAAAFTLAYIVAFSMAIPVVYPSEIEHKRLFHIVESIVSFAMVVIFAIMLFGLLTGNYALALHPAFLLFALAGDALVLGLRWKEKINWFVLVSLALALLLWMIVAVAGLAH